MSKKVIQGALSHIFRGIDMLQKHFSHRLFTIDGRLVGDIGEIIAATEFDIKLDDKGRAVHRRGNKRRALGADQGHLPRPIISSQIEIRTRKVFS
jgi:hypothetical protein